MTGKRKAKTIVYVVQPRNWEYNDQTYDDHGLDKPEAVSLTKRAAQEFAESAELKAWRGQFGQYQNPAVIKINEIMEFNDGLDLSEDRMTEVLQSAGIRYDLPAGGKLEALRVELTDSQLLSLIRALPEIRFREITEVEMLGIDPHEFLSVVEDAVRPEQRV